ncbi:MAG: ankyrin repeat domain-containing protein [Verrucomicrobiales bacterium]|nr:ankyrin repeat domain-containing protein [Verrucomicrobiales bacterium]
MSDLIRFAVPFIILAIYFFISLLALIILFKRISRTTRWLVFFPLFLSLAISAWLVLSADLVNSFSARRSDIIGAMCITLFYTPAIALFLWAILYGARFIAKRKYDFSRLLGFVVALVLIFLTISWAGYIFSKNVVIQQRTYYSRLVTLPFAVDVRFDNWLKTKQPKLYTALTGRRIPLTPKPADLLLAASRAGDLTQVTSLIAGGADCNQPNQDGLLPLVEAARYDNIAVLQYLLSKGAKINQTGKNGDSALGAAADYNRTDSALVLIDAGADCNWVSTNGKFTPLMLAGWWQNNKLAACLLKNGADPNGSNHKNTALSYAVGANNLELAKLLLASGAKLSFKGLLPKPLLSYAAANNQVPMMEFLLQQGCTVDEADNSGATPLMAAAQHNKTEAIDFLLKHGASINLADHEKSTALLYAAASNRSAAIKLLVERGANVNLANQNGRVALMYAANARQANDGTLSALIASKANINARDHDGESPLIYAAKNHSGNLQPFEILLAAGADINLQDNRGETALTQAGNLGLNDVVDYLRGKGAVVTDLHIIPNPPRQDPLPKDKTWALAVSAIYTQVNGWDQQYLGGLDKRSRSLQQTLREEWNIGNKQDLLDTLKWLNEEGHRKEYQELGKKNSAMSDSQFADYLKTLPDDEAGEAKSTREIYSKWGERSAVAWDLCSYAYVVQLAYDAKYLKEDEAWNLLLSNAREIQKYFSSWQEMGQNFLDGRYVWAGKRVANHENCYKLLSNPADPNSPWNNVPWDYNLSSPKTASGQNIPATALDKAPSPR